MPRTTAQKSGENANTAPVKMEDQKKRRYISQADVPGVSLEQALRVPTAINDNYGGDATKPVRLAEALNMSPTSGNLRELCGASIAYGLTEGGSSAERISMTALARRIAAPTTEGDDRLALKQACLVPRVVGEFLHKYNNRKLPPQNIATNVLRDMGVPAERTKRTLDLILENARYVGFIRQIKGQDFIDLDAENARYDDAINSDGFESTVVDDPERALQPELKLVSSAGAADVSAKLSNNRVFITHGRNKEIVEQLKELLSFGKFEPIVSMERETVSKPVPDKVMDDMRSCFAAIIHVGTETKVMDEAGQEHRILNSNVLIEIGAAMALYGRRFILLVERGTTLPSNLQGLYEVRFDGDKLDYEATMKLLKAFNDFRS